MKAATALDCEQICEGGEMVLESFDESQSANVSESSSGGEIKTTKKGRTIGKQATFDLPAKF